MATPQVLTTWKEIAAYMGKGVRTVQRWEEELGLPVHRPGEDRHIVLAFPSELDAWARRVPPASAVQIAKTSFGEKRSHSHKARAENKVRVEQLHALMLNIFERTKETRERTALLVARCKAVAESRQQQSQRVQQLREFKEALPPATTKGTTEQSLATAAE